MSSHRLRAFLVATALLVLSACATRPPARETAPLDMAAARADELRRNALHDWDLSGRIAVSNGSRGGSGRIDWRQRAEAYTISLSAPVTRQSWQLVGDPSGARLKGIAGGPRESGDAEGLLRSATGWSIPVRALQSWVRGIGAPDPEYGAARLVYDDGGLPSKLEQAGWAIEYQAWYPSGVDVPSLPKRIVARRGEASVKLVVDGWDLTAR
jgi:outer membrane lipoprotein LolB